MLLGFTNFIRVLLMQVRRKPATQPSKATLIMALGLSLGLLHWVALDVSPILIEIAKLHSIDLPAN